MINADCVHGYALIIQYFPAGYVHHLVAGLLQGLSDERFWEGMKPDSGMGSEEQNFHRSSVDKYQFMLVPFFAYPPNKCSANRCRRLRTPTTTSAPASIRSTNCFSSAGSCCPSASSVMITSLPSSAAFLNPELNAES